MKIHLLKGKSDDLEFGRTDPYEDHIPNVRFIPILSYHPVEVDELVMELKKDYDALIVTSQRAVDVLKQAIEKDSDCRRILDLDTYTVGPTTASRLELLGFSSVMGSSSGHGGALAESMISALDQTKSFLFLAGEVHRRLLPDRLVAAGHNVNTRIVYRTEAHDYCRTLDSSVNANDWIVFFSPSGSEAACNFIKGLPFQVNVGAIGPTTKAYLHEQNITVCAMADEPTAQSLSEAIKAYKH